MFSIRGEYLASALEERYFKEESEKVETLEAISSYSGEIELVLTGPINRPLATNSHVEAAKEFGLTPVNAHAASEIENLSNQDGVSEVMTRMRNMQLKSKRDKRERIDWDPKYISSHPARLERDVDFEENVRSAIYNVSQIPFHVKDDIIDGEILIENVVSSYGNPFILESVDDARTWETIVEENLPKYARENVAYVVDVGHTDQPIEMMDSLGRNTKEYHLHNRVPQEGGEISAESREPYDTHRAPWDGDIDMNNILEERDNDADIVWEVRPDYLSAEVVEETYDRFGHV